MRNIAAFVLLPALLAGCVPHIPVRRDFGTSALAAPADTPPEFARFNAYDPAVGALVANQICATPYTRIEERAIDAAPGALVQTRGRCQTHVPFFGDGDFLPGTPARQP